MLDPIRIALFLSLLPGVHLSACPGEISVSDAWVSEAPPGVSVNAGYLKIENKTHKNMSLQSLESPDYERTEMHLSLEREGITRMHRQSEIEIAAKSKFEFAPGAYHLMLFGPHRKIQRGEFVRLILHFDGEPEVSVDAEVKQLKLDQSQHH
jgi:copper(I)-binding protein